jgi:hypothetical protein
VKTLSAAALLLAALLLWPRPADPLPGFPHVFLWAWCRSSAGVSLDEPLREPPSAARLYIFNPRPWTAATYRAALREVRQWH